QHGYPPVVVDLEIPGRPRPCRLPVPRRNPIRHRGALSGPPSPWPPARVPFPPGPRLLLRRSVRRFHGPHQWVRDFGPPDAESRLAALDAERLGGGTGTHPDAASPPADIGRAVPRVAREVQAVQGALPGPKAQVLPKPSPVALAGALAPDVRRHIAYVERRRPAPRDHEDEVYVRRDSREGSRRLGWVLHEGPRHEGPRAEHDRRGERCRGQPRERGRRIRPRAELLREGESLRDGLCGRRGARPLGVPSREYLDKALAEAKKAGHPVVLDMKTPTSRW